MTLHIYMNINAKTKTILIIGDPVEHSLSPQMHNAAYESLGIDGEFVFVTANVKPENLQNAILGIRAMQIHGITVTHPHKLAVMRYLDTVDETAKKIGAVNTIVNDKGILKGYNTDWLGILTPLEKITKLTGKKVAILGAGGAARAMAYAVSSKGAKFTVYNRTLNNAQKLAQEFGGEARILSQISEVKDADIILNASSIGMQPLENKTPLPKKYINSKHIIFDAIYAPYETQLLKDAKEKGAKIIHGTEMLLYQGMAQFKIYTGKKAPEKVMGKAIMETIHLEGVHSATFQENRK